MSTASGPRETVVFVKSITGAECAAGAEVMVNVDNVVGAHGRSDDGRWGHFLGFRLKVQGTLATDVAMTQTMPGSLLCSVVQNIRVRAAQKDLYVGQLDGEDLYMATFAMHRSVLTPPPADVADATATGVATGAIWIPIPLTTNSGMVLGDRTGDDAIPVAAFSRSLDPESGIRFKFANAVGTASGNSSFKGFLNVVLSTITSCDVYAVYRTEGALNVGMIGIRGFSESNSSFDLAPIGGDEGSQRLVMFLDPPSVTTGKRTYTGYDNISARFGQNTLYTGRSYLHLIEMSNIAGPTNPGITTGWLYLDPSSASSTWFLPLYSRRANQALGDDPRGRLSVSIGTRTTSSQRIIQVCRQQYDSDSAQRIAQAVGGADKIADVKAVVGSSHALANTIDRKLVTK